MHHLTSFELPPIGVESAPERERPTASSQPRVPEPAEMRNARSHHHRGGVVADIGLPLVAYYSLHALGASDRTALTAAAIAAGVRLVWEALRRRHLTWFASIMLAIFGMGAVLTLTGGDPRTILLKDSAGTALVGLAFLFSLAGRTPLTLEATRTWRPDRAERVARLYRSDPRVRRVFRVATLGWGVGMLGESLVRVPLVYLFPIDVMVGLSTVLMIGAMAGLVVWNAVYVRRAVRRTPALGILLPPGMS
jgi:hypothetical protein